MRRILILIFIMLSSGVSTADEWTDKITIQSLSTSRADFEQEVTITDTCVNDNKAFLDSNVSNYKESFSILLAANMANKQIQLYCSDSCESTTRCRILDVKIYNH